MNSLINYVYEFGSGRGKLRKSPFISSYSTAFCELSIAVQSSFKSLRQAYMYRKTLLVLLEENNYVLLAWVKEKK